MESEKLTEDELQEWVEHRGDYIGLPGRAGRVVLNSVASIVYAFSVSKNEIRPQTIRRLDDAANILRELFLCTGREPVWQHRTDLVNEFYRTGYQDTTTSLYRRSISNVAAALVERPWLESHFAEWAIVDSLVCNEIREFGRSILEESEFKLREILFVGNKALQGEGIENVILGINRAKVINWLIRLVFFLGFPIAGIIYGFYYNHTWILFLSIAILGLYLSYVTYSTAKAIIMNLLGRLPPKTQFQNKVERWGAMSPRKLSRVGLDLVAARLAPHDQPHLRVRRIAERHRRAGW
jgi:hypothetical protein